MSNFKIILTAVFAVCFVVGIILFATFRAGAGQTTANLTVWGVIPTDAFQAAYKNSSVAKNKYITVNYVKKDPATFDSDFVEALADGAGPDVVVLREDSLFKNSNKLFVIPYKSFPEGDFKSEFVQEGQMFLTAAGVSAVPLMIDPMVMYWNRDIFSNNFVSQPPQYWDYNFYNLVNTMTKKDSSANIMQSAVAFGGYDNITDAKEIISLLLLQAGTPIVDYSNGSYSSVLNSQLGKAIAPGQSALDFYTQFSNPTSASYSWNSSLPSSQNFFLSGDLAMYFGFASEISDIQQKNPNLNFDVTGVPQITGDTKIDFAHMYASAIVKQSKNTAADFALVTALSEPAAQTALSAVTNLPPVRNDLLSEKPTDDYRAVFYDSAIISRGWVDPDTVATAGIFRDMINGINSGQSGVSEALDGVSQQIDSLLQK
jgi:maltose-binding protein MalE